MTERETASNIEHIALAKSGQKLKYSPLEKIGVITVDNFPALGKLAALSFLEWVQGHPKGVISLPTGKTPEHFIKWVTHYLQNWNENEVKIDLSENGIDTQIYPEMKNLHFVQIDEFYPIHPQQQNSFFYYVNKFYIDGFGLDRRKALLIDCSRIGLPDDIGLDDVWPEDKVDLSLRYRYGKNSLEKLQKKVLENIDQWCVEYEQKIRSIGGIGFFLGGIGPDGHIGFNVQGSDFHSTTRLTETNYETQAAAATDLGGIDIARNRLVITIGLKTITFDQACRAIIIAAGESKSKVVADAIQSEKHIHYPATVLQELPNARFYLTNGAAKNLIERQYQILLKNTEISEELQEKIIIDLAVQQKKRLKDLTFIDFEQDKTASELLKHIQGDVKTVTDKVEKNIFRKIKEGTVSHTDTVFLHTEPHHDDIMLGYLPLVVRSTRTGTNKHFFLALTSGFTAVTNSHVLTLLKNLKKYLDKGSFDRLLKEGYFEPSNKTGRNRDVWQYLDGVAANNYNLKSEGEARRLLSNLMFIFEDYNIDNLKNRITELINYFETQYPGKKDLPHIQRLKGMIREWEADCLWGYFGANSSAVMHARLGFYKGEIFTEEPTMDRDVRPVLEILRKVKPNIVTVALDPEASGPDTHYKVLQVIVEALKLWEKESGNSDIQVWGYRNVWYRFHPSEANIIAPVSLNMFSVLDSAFGNAFVSQKGAAFPSYEYDGPFSELAQKIQVEQYQKIKTCLGREYFYENTNPLIRATRGFIFLKKLTLAEFYEKAIELRKSTENL